MVLVRQMKSAKAASSPGYTLNDWEVDRRPMGPIQRSPALQRESDNPGDGDPTGVGTRSVPQQYGLGRPDEEDIPEAAVAPD